MASPKRIFEGVRIVDLTQWLAGPVATRLFADLGAEIIKVELPPHGEQSRRIASAATTAARICRGCTSRCTIAVRSASV